MNTNNYSTCGNCGRSFATVSGPTCPSTNACLSEYPCTMNACIKNKKADCLAKAVIPSITVEHVDGLTSLANSFVHVTDNNTTYYIDDKHRPMLVWSGPIEIEGYDINTNPLNLRKQTCYTRVEGVYSEVYFDTLGKAHIMGTEA